MNSLLSRARSVAVSAGGGLLAGATRVVAAARPAAKPLHPHGEVRGAQLRRSGSDVPTGVAWIDEPGTDEVLVRRSRAIGLPGALPDIHGLAVRVPLAEGGHADVLLASTGLGRLTRFTLTAARSPERRPMTTLMPYRSPTGPLLLAATPAGEHVELAWARPGGDWHRFGELVLAAPAAAGDALISFDPVRNPVPGLDSYDWVRRLREPAYATARHSR